MYESKILKFSIVSKIDGGKYEIFVLKNYIKVFADNSVIREKKSFILPFNRNFDIVALKLSNYYGNNLDISLAPEDIRLFCEKIVKNKAFI